MNVWPRRASHWGLVFFIIPLLLGGCCTPPPASSKIACSKGRTVIVVRHAEKEKPPTPAPAPAPAPSDESDAGVSESSSGNFNVKDPPLSALGRLRAKELAAMLAHSGVTRLIASQYKRTQETLLPLGERVALKVEVRSADKTGDLIRELRAEPDGSVVVVATHSNVVPLVVRELGGGATALRGVEGDALAEDDYSRVIIISEPCGAASVVELRSPPAAVFP